MNTSTGPKIEIYLDKLDREAKEIPLLQDHHSQINALHELLLDYGRIYESTLNELFMIDRGKASLLNRSVESIKSLFRMEQSMYMQEIEAIRTEKNDYMGYARRTEREIANIRTKLQHYLNLNNVPETSEGKKKLVELLLSTKDFVMDQLVRKEQPRPYNSQKLVKGRNAEKDEEKEDDKCSSNLGKTLKALYHKMQQQTVNLLGELTKVQATVEYKIQAEPQHACDPKVIGLEMDKAVQEIKKKTVKDVLKLIHEKRPKVVDFAGQTESSKTDCWLKMERSYLKEQKELKDKIFMLNKELNRIKEDHMRQANDLTTLLKGETEKSESMSEIFQDVRKLMRILETKPEITYEDIQYIKNTLLQFSLCDYRKQECN
eukprot:TRINITY_DN3409_c0_g1_i1.p2 TRINITY_DN3409_c0_g1~~TRINITY_DN3409_c0_g1_i1.p2  ORF type:complete len:375 (-),score=63.51 TRINITY_DN3409_c0_g1_i1:3559-4683(-)